MPLRELLPVRAQDEPVMDHLGQLAAERARDALLNLHVRPVVRSANHVRDLEVEIVDDGRELVGRAAVATQQRGAGAGEPHRAVVVALRATALERACRCCRVDLTARALPNRPFVELDVEPGQIAEDRVLTTLRPFVSDPCRRSAAASTPPFTSAKRRFATAVSALPRCSEPVGLGAKRTRTGTHYASIGMCPG